MKKLIMLVLLCCVLFTAAAAEDYSSVSTEELMRQHELILEELTQRRMDESGRTLIADEFGVKIYFDGFTDTEAGKDQLRFTVLNQSEETLPLEICADSICIDNWNVLKDGTIVTLDRGTNGAGQPVISWEECATADKDTASKVDVKFVYKVEKEGSGSETIYETGLITFYINGNEAAPDDQEDAALPQEIPQEDQGAEAEPPAEEAPQEEQSAKAAAPVSGSALECKGELVGGTIFTGPEEITVRIEIRNAGDEDFPAPLILYYPDLKPVDGFGSGAMLAGASEKWEGTWTITEKELEDSEIAFYVRYPLIDEETGEITYKAKKLKFRITVPEPEKEETPEQEEQPEEEEGRAFPVQGVTTVSVNMRKGPSKNDGIIKTLKKGQSLEILEIVVNAKNEEWARVEINGKTGYVMMEYIKTE